MVTTRAMPRRTTRSSLGIGGIVDDADD